MELAENNLQTVIQQGMSKFDKADAIQQVLNGVELIHKNNYIHRDLNPRNILKYSDGRYKITDFGLVKDMDLIRAEVKTRFNPEGLGSLGYRAPEVVDSGLFSEQSDIYAVGKIINDVYGRAASPAINRVISKSTLFFPEERYSSIDELRKDFVNAVNQVAEAV